MGDPGFERFTIHGPREGAGCLAGQQAAPRVRRMEVTMSLKKGPPDGQPLNQFRLVSAYASARRRIMPKPNMESSAIAMRAMVEGSGASLVDPV